MWAEATEGVRDQVASGGGGPNASSSEGLDGGDVFIMAFGKEVPT